MDVQELTRAAATTASSAASAAASTRTWCSSAACSTPTNGTVNGELWDWLQGILCGARPVARYDGIIEVLTPSGDAVARPGRSTAACPRRSRGPELNAKTGEIAIEELHHRPRRPAPEDLRHARPRQSDLQEISATEPAEPVNGDPAVRSSSIRRH